MATAKEKEAEGRMDERSCCQELREEFRLHRFKLEHPHPVHFVSLQVRTKYEMFSTKFILDY